MDSQLHSRRKGDVVRLEIEAGAPAEIIEPLTASIWVAAVASVQDQWPGQPLAAVFAGGADRPSGSEVPAFHLAQPESGAESIEFVGRIRKQDTCCCIILTIPISR